MPFPGDAPHRESASERAPHGPGAADSRDVFRAAGENERRARPGRRVRAGAGLRRVSEVATAVCIRQATPPLANERARVLRRRRARPGRLASVPKARARASAIADGSERVLIAIPDCSVSSQAGVCLAPAKAPAPRAMRRCCQGVLPRLRGSGRPSLARRSGCLPMRFSPSTGPRPAVAGSSRRPHAASAGAGACTRGKTCSTQTPVLRREERSLEAAVVKQNDNAFGAGSAVLGLADVSPAGSAMERAGLHVRLRSLRRGARCRAARRRAHPDRRTNPTASPRKSSGYGCLVFGTLDAGSVDAVDNDETGPRRRGPVRG
jgi:hypothetical protein